MRAPVAPVIAFAALVVLLLGCDQARTEAPPETYASTTPKPVESGEEALALARACVNADPAGFPSVWGSTLEVDAATAARSAGGDWLVSIPESGRDRDGNPVPLGAPRGRDVVVRTWTRDCVRAPMD